MKRFGSDKLSEHERTLLEKRLRSGRTANRDSPPRRGLRGQSRPLSASQEQLWYFSRLVPDNPVYNEIVTIRKDGPLDVHALESAFSELVRRHEILRSSFPATDDGPVQVVRAASDSELLLIDLAHLPAEEAERRAVRIAVEKARLAYDLESGPLLRPILMRFAPAHHRLYLAMHHLIFDGVTVNRIFLPELIALYDSARVGNPFSLDEPPLQYGDYADWERRWIESPAAAKRIAWWRAHLANASTLELPLDRMRPRVARFKGGAEPVTVSVTLADQLRALGRDIGATLFQVIAASFAVLLHRYANQTDVLFGTVSNLRQRVEFESLAGYCATPLVVRCDLQGDPSFRALIRRIGDQLIDGLDHVVPFERLVRALQPPRGAGGNPIFQSMLVLEPRMDSTDPAWNSHLMDSTLAAAIGSAKFDLHLELDERPDGHIAGRMVYDADLFDAETVRRMIGHWHRLVESGVADPALPVSELSLLSAQETRQQIFDWNATAFPFPDAACVHDLIAAQAARTPDTVAVVCGDDRLKYGDLDLRAEGVAHALSLAGVRPGALVAMCMERSTDMVVGMLGVLKAGAAYVPLDPRHPIDRLAFMLSDCDATLLLTQSWLSESLPSGRPSTVFIDQIDALDGATRATATESVITTPHDLAYILYTSGSTGRPKGVRVLHANVVNLMTAMAQQPGLGPTDCLLSSSSYCFDMFVGDVFPSLAIGARIVLATHDEVVDARLLAALISSAGATVMHATPAMWQTLVATGWTGDPRLLAVSGGEPLSNVLAKALLDRCGAVWNGYGPTEATVYATFSRVGPNDVITIGRPSVNRRIYLLDARLQPVPIGVRGEIFVAGQGVAAGYLNREEETAKRFLEDPFVAGERMYRTGDQARLLADGRIQHLGRLDDQVKIRGIRIELGEIEAALLAMPGVEAAAVILREDHPGNQRLVAYVVADKESLTASQLRTSLRETLPEQFVPSAIVVLPVLPITSSGKVDRSALPPPGESPSVELEPDEPRSDSERRLARIWANTLNVEGIGRLDNFFDLGGHSLLAVQMIMAVERDLAVDLPLAVLFEGGATLAGLGVIIDKKRTEGAVAVAEAGRPSPATPTLFFVLPNEPSMMPLRHFAEPFGRDIRAVGLLPGRVDRRLRSPRRVEQLASPLVTQIYEAQPKGPYYLAGYSLGGILAYELAKQLQRKGEEVAWLCILDVATPERIRAWVGLGARLRRQPALGVRAFCRKSVVHLRGGIKKAIGGLHTGVSPASEDFDYFAAMKLVARYRAQDSDVPMDLFVTLESERRYGSDSLGWRDLHKGALAVQRATGDHSSMLQQPHATHLAVAVAARMRQSREQREPSAPETSAIAGAKPG